MNTTRPHETLKDLSFALPESRELNALSELFQRRGATVERVPLVSIHDNPDENAVLSWLTAFINHTPDILIILTGEGIRRITGFAERNHLLDAWKQALARTYTLARGPKPDRALFQLDLKANARAAAPTTEGVIRTLETMDLSNKRLSVQLYGQNPNQVLQDYLLSKGLHYDTVAPYIYASDSETDKVSALIQKLAQKQLDFICFTSKAQYDRLEKVASQTQQQDALNTGLQHTRIAAVGPVVADQLSAAGYTIDVMPTQKFFMNSMVRAIEELFKAH